MKKVTVLTFLILISILKIKAQDGGTKIGFKVGFSNSEYLGNDWKTTISSGLVLDKQSISYKTSFTGALALNSEVSEYLWLKHEFWFSRRGAIVDGSFGERYRIKRYYIDMAPIVLAGHFRGFQFFVGPTASIMVNKKDTWTPIVGDKQEFTDMDDETVFDYGLMLGTEYEFPFGLNLGVRFMKGLNKLDMNSEQKWYNSAVFFTTGWSFGKLKN